MLFQDEGKMHRRHRGTRTSYQETGVDIVLTNRGAARPYRILWSLGNSCNRWIYFVEAEFLPVGAILARANTPSRGA